MSELGRSVGLLSGQQLVLMVLGAARTKLVAAMLGPAGMGLLAQTSSFHDLLRQVSLLGASNGFLKLFAEFFARGDRRALERLIPSALLVFGGIALVLVGVSVALAPLLAPLVFDDGRLGYLVVLGALGVVFAVPLTLAQRMLSGALRLRAYVTLALGDALFGLVAMATLAAFFGLPGAACSLVLAELSALAIGIVLLRRHVVEPLGLVLRLRIPDRAIVGRLMRLAGVLALTSVAASGAALLVRSEIIRRYGAGANGLYQVAWQVGQNYLGILSASLWTYGMPKVATKLDDPGAVSNLQNDFLRIALVVLAPGIVLLASTRELWVPVLYTSAFLAAGPMLCWQLGGELVAMLRQSMNITLLPRERLGFLLFQALLYWGGWVVGSVLLLPRHGALAVAMAYCGANLTALVATFAYHAGCQGYRIRADNLRLLLLALPGFPLAMALAGGGPGWARVVPLALVAGWLIGHRRFYVAALASIGLRVRRERAGP